MNYNQKLDIAKLAYRAIIEAIESFEGNELGVYFYWAKQVEVDGEMFFKHQLENSNQQ